jgi:fibronectin type 3 domain-containing protein
MDACLRFLRWLALAVILVLAGSVATGAQQPAFTAAPAAPAWVTATDGVYYDKVRVTWAAVAGATYYKYATRMWRPPNTTIYWWEELTGTTHDFTFTAPGDMDYWMIAACNADGCSSYQSDDLGWRAIHAPIGLQASDAQYADKVHLTWNESDEASSYAVYRGLTSSDMDLLAYSVATNSYDDTSAAVGTTYYYRVKACTDACSVESAYNTGSRGLTAPAAPQASDGTYPDKIAVSWPAVNGATYYELWRSSSAGGSKTKVSSPAGTSYNDTYYLLARGVPYYYWVKACNAYLCSDFSPCDTGYLGATPTGTPTVTVMFSPTRTSTATPVLSATPTASPTSTATSQVGATSTRTPTVTITQTPAGTRTPTATRRPNMTPRASLPLLPRRR